MAFSSLGPPVRPEDEKSSPIYEYKLLALQTTSHHCLQIHISSSQNLGISLVVLAYVILFRVLILYLVGYHFPISLVGRDVLS